MSGSATLTMNRSRLASTTAAHTMNRTRPEEASARRSWLSLPIVSYPTGYGCRPHDRDARAAQRLGSAPLLDRQGARRREHADRVPDPARGPLRRHALRRVRRADGRERADHRGAAARARRGRPARQGAVQGARAAHAARLPADREGPGATARAGRPDAVGRPLGGTGRRAGPPRARRLRRARARRAALRGGPPGPWRRARARLQPARVARDLDHREAERRHGRRPKLALWLGLQCTENRSRLIWQTSTT